MKRLIILVTESYPYTGGIVESFLDEEIRTIQERGITNVIEILIVSISQRGPAVNFPEKMKVLGPILGQRENKVKKALKVVTSNYFYKAVFERLFFNRANSGSLISDIKTILHESYKYEKAYEFFKDLLLKLNQPVGFYTYWFTPATSALLSLKQSERFKNKILFVVSRAHRYDLYDYVSYHPLRRHDLTLIDKVFPVSQDGVKYIFERYGVKTEVRYLGVRRVAENVFCGTNDFHKIESMQSVKILSCSHLVRVKRVDLIAKSIVEFCKIFPNRNVIWTHIGDGNEREKVFEILRHSNVTNLTFDFRGHVPNNEVRKIMHSEVFHCIINLSESEGLPVSLMEAAEAGIPLIATDVGGTKEIVENTGILLDKNVSPNDVAQAINEVLDNYEEYSRKSKEKFSQFFDADSNYPAFWNELIQLYDERIKKGV